MMSNIKHKIFSLFVLVVFLLSVFHELVPHTHHSHKNEHSHSQSHSHSSDKHHHHHHDEDSSDGSGKNTIDHHSHSVHQHEQLNFVVNKVEKELRFLDLNLAAFFKYEIYNLKEPKKYFRFLNDRILQTQQFPSSPLRGPPSLV